MATKNKTAAAKSAERKLLEAKYIATVTLQSSANAAAVIETYGKAFGEQDINQLIEPLNKAMTDMNGGNMSRVENMLYGQAHALQSIFVNLSRRAANQDQLKQYETFLRLALKAQSQCRATLETLASVKNPPVVFAKQANMTTGPMQVNNGTAAPSHAKENEIQPSKLLEAQHGNFLDTPTTGATVGSYQEVETVEALDRAEVGRR